MAQSTFEQALAEVDRLIDGPGTHVDAGIRNVVAALRMHGVDTIASCEGHLDHGYPFPWIDIGTSERMPHKEPPVDQAIQELAAGLQQSAVKTGNVKIHATVIDGKDWFYIEADSKKVNARKHVEETMSTKIRFHGLKQMLLITKLLDRFYTANPTPYFTMIGIEPFGNKSSVRIRLQSNGAEAVKLMTKSEQLKQLTLLQNHMNELTDFLINLDPIREIQPPN